MSTHFVRANGAPLSWESAELIAAAIDGFDSGKVYLDEMPSGRHARFYQGSLRCVARDSRRVQFADFIRESLGYYHLEPALNEARKIRRQIRILQEKQAA